MEAGDQVNAKSPYAGLGTGHWFFAPRGEGLACLARYSKEGKHMRAIRQAAADALEAVADDFSPIVTMGFDGFIDDQNKARKSNNVTVYP